MRLIKMIIQKMQRQPQNMTESVFIDCGSEVGRSLRYFTVFALVVVYVLLIQLHFDFRCVRGLRTRFADNSHNKKQGTKKIPKQAQLMLKVLKI